VRDGDFIRLWRGVERFRWGMGREEQATAGVCGGSWAWLVGSGCIDEMPVEGMSSIALILDQRLNVAM
jgi:hypothetical protein